MWILTSMTTLRTQQQQHLHLLSALAILEAWPKHKMVCWLFNVVQDLRYGVA